MAALVEVCNSSHNNLAKILFQVTFLKFLSGHLETLIYSREELITVQLPFSSDISSVFVHKIGPWL